jgi:RNA polymerase sigma-70 factor (ECF subfamily)
MYRRHRDDILRYLLGWLRDHSTAEDLTSETFLRAIHAAPRLRDDTEELLPWLRTIARNLVRDHAKSAYRRREFSTAVLPEESGVARDPCQHVVAACEARLLLAAMRELNEDQRRCLVLRFNDDCTVQQTAKLMARDTGAVKALQYRAVRKLKEILATEAVADRHGQAAS